MGRLTEESESLVGETQVKLAVSEVDPDTRNPY